MFDVLDHIVHNLAITCVRMLLGNICLELGAL